MEPLDLTDRHPEQEIATMPRHPLCNVLGAHPAHDMAHPIDDRRTIPCPGEEPTGGPTFGENGEVLKLWAWFGQPEGAHERLVMVVVDNTEHGPTFQPLISLTAEHAETNRPIAESAYSELGVPVVLRTFVAEFLVEEIPG